MFRDVAYPEQLAILEAVHVEYCELIGVHPKGEEGGQIAQRVIALFKGGSETHEALMQGLRKPRPL